MCVKYVCQQCVGFPSFALPPLSLSLSNPLCSTHLWRSTWWIAELTPTLCAASLSSPSSASLSSQMLYRYEDGTSLANRWRMVANTRVCVCVRLVLCSCARANWMACWSLSVTCPNQPDELHTRDWAKQIAFWMSLFFSVCFVIFHITHTFGFHLPERV